MPATSADTFVHLPADSNQALGIAQYAIDFMAGKLGDGPADSVWKKTELFHTDSVFCGLSALALGTNAPTLLRDEALVPLGRRRRVPRTLHDARSNPFGTSQRVKAEKAVVNSSAVRWDSNGTNFGYDPARGNTAGEFGHNDFYPVCVAAAQMLGPDAGGTGEYALRGMICLDEIRGRLAECFSLKSTRSTMSSTARSPAPPLSGAMVGPPPNRSSRPSAWSSLTTSPGAIRAASSPTPGRQRAISTEMAVLSLKQPWPASSARASSATRGHLPLLRTNHRGDKRRTEMALRPSTCTSHSGEDFAVMGMHFRLGLYEHQSAARCRA